MLKKFDVFSFDKKQALEPLESILIREIATYMFYDFQAKKELDTMNHEVLDAVLDSLTITLFKYWRELGLKEENHINTLMCIIIKLFNDGFVPVGISGNDLLMIDDFIDNYCVDIAYDNLMEWIKCI